MDNLIRFNCGRCDKRLKFQAEFAGKESRCPKCGNDLTLPKRFVSPPPINLTNPASPSRHSPTTTSSRRSLFIASSSLILLSITCTLLFYLFRDVQSREDKSSEAPSPTLTTQPGNSSVLNVDNSPKPESTTVHPDTEDSNKKLPTETPSQSNEVFPLTVGNSWTYRLTVPNSTLLPVNPFFVDKPGLMSTSKTHGLLNWEKTDKTFNLRITDSISDSVLRLEADQPGLRLWLPPLNFKDIRGKVFENENYRGLTLHGVIIDKPKPDDFIVGHVLFRTPTDPTKQNYTNVEVEAGRFEVMESTIDYTTQDSRMPRYTEKAWIRPGIGMVKFVMMDAEKKELCKMELVEYDVNSAR